MSGRSERLNLEVNNSPLIHELRLRGNECANLNRELPKHGLAKLTWGNASIISNDRKYLTIKSSGVRFDHLHDYSTMCVVEIDTGEVVYGNKPSVDTPIHIEIYKAFQDVKSVIHTHSTYATTFAQAKMKIPCLGTTHADHFFGPIPLVRSLTASEIETEYEANIGKVVVQHFKDNNLNPSCIPGVLLPSHGVLVFGESSSKALENAIAIEEIAQMAYQTLTLDSEARLFNEDTLYFKHFERKHGSKKYYGQ